MKVVLKVTVYDRIAADIEKAYRDRREVDYVVVSQEEYAELRHDRRSMDALESDLMNFSAASARINAAATFKVGRFEFTSTDPHARRACRGEYLQVPSHETFMGKTLYVVPKEYMPR